MPTSIIQRAELFHKPGPEAALEYLWGRLQDRDLSQAEALAMLSAVHRELASRKAPDPKVYFTYSRFMEALNREMPVVHDYVVAHWIQNRRQARRERRQEADAPVPEDDRRVETAGGSNNEPVKAFSDARALPATEMMDGHAEPGEPGESDDERSAEAPTRPRAEPPEDDQPAGPPEEDEDGERREDDSSEQDETEDSAEDAAGQEEATDAEPPEAEEQPGPAQDESSSDDEPAESPEAEEPAEAAAAGAEEGQGVESSSEPAAEPEEGEWPQMEESEPEEPLEGAE